MENKAPKQGKWYMTIIGGLIGLVLGLILPSLSIILFDQLYYICLMFAPILACLFIKLLGGCKNIFSLLYAILIYLITTVVAGFMLEANALVQYFALPKFEHFRLTALMIAEFSSYGPNVWANLTRDIFDIIVLIGYLAVGILFSWEFILRPNDKKSDEEAVESSEKTENEEEFEYVYEDELEADDEIVE